MPNDINMSTRKVLNQIGLTSSTAVKRVMRDWPNADGRAFDARLLLKSRLDLKGSVAGQLTGLG